MRIGELSERSGASARSLRYYEEVGLIESRRTTSNQRVFDDSTVARVALIRTLLAAGLPTRTIAGVLPCMTDPDSQTPHLTRALLDERDRIDAAIDRLAHMRRRLDLVIAEAPPLPGHDRRRAHH
jgi:DNA-binding transcriptional MerR regulator